MKSGYFHHFKFWSKVILEQLNYLKIVFLLQFFGLRDVKLEKRSSQIILYFPLYFQLFMSTLTYEYFTFFKTPRILPIIFWILLHNIFLHLHSQNYQCYPNLQNWSHNCSQIFWFVLKPEHLKMYHRQALISNRLYLFVHFALTYNYFIL